MGLTRHNRGVLLQVVKRWIPQQSSTVRLNDLLNTIWVNCSQTRTNSGKGTKNNNEFNIPKHGMQHFKVRSRRQQAVLQKLSCKLAIRNHTLNERSTLSSNSASTDKHFNNKVNSLYPLPTVEKSDKPSSRIRFKRKQSQYTLLQLSPRPQFNLAPFNSKPLQGIKDNI